MRLSLSNPRALLEDVLGKPMTRELWSGNYEKALPLTVFDVDLAAVLPAVFYSFRFAQRRGRGRFLEVFGAESPSPRERRKGATAERIAAKLCDRLEWFSGFDGETERAILADLLLGFCLENRLHALSRQEQVQRVLPTHYMASWVDLPEHVAHLRSVPETPVALLANQPRGERIEQTPDQARTRFAVGHGFEQNLLLRVFGSGMRIEGPYGDRAADRFDESTPVGLDQFLTIRLAQALGAAPDKNRVDGAAEIPNRLPIAEVAAKHFAEDLRRFLRAYAEAVPRHALVELLESCMAVGFTTVFASVVQAMLEWAATGKVPAREAQAPVPLFVDCSSGLDSELRAAAEASFSDFFRTAERLPFVFTLARLLDYSVRHDPTLR
ncbi:MAG: hypothetical protein N3C12_01415 [Candidatus Binatia bacterium]|nr:hypothetical protein [Candidatus Binatia bacterium]